MCNICAIMRLYLRSILPEFLVDHIYYTLKKKTIYICFSNLTYEWLISSSSDSELVKIEMDDCVIEYVSAKVPFCQII
jgi:hypothetical protein